MHDIENTTKNTAETASPPMSVTAPDMADMAVGKQPATPIGAPVDPQAEALAAEERERAAERAERSSRAMRVRGFARWAVMGGVRVGYRGWTRVAAKAFPEDSRQAQWANTLGIPLPDSMNMSWITPHLAVGGRIHPEDIPRLARSGVSRVVDTRSEYKDDERALAGSGISLLYLPTPDTYPLTVEDLDRGARWINEQIAAGQRVLIHCEHGVGRSVMLTAASLIADGMRAQDAIRLIQRKRWQAAPNHRQVLRLQEFERALRAPGAAQAHHTR